MSQQWEPARTPWWGVCLIALGWLGFLGVMVYFVLLLEAHKWPG